MGPRPPLGKKLVLSSHERDAEKLWVSFPAASPRVEDDAVVVVYVVVVVAAAATVWQEGRREGGGRYFPDEERRNQGRE